MAKVLELAARREELRMQVELVRCYRLLVEVREVLELVEAELRAEFGSGGSSPAA